MTNRTIRKHEFDTDTFIFPRGRWECYVCLQPKIWLEVVDIHDDRVCLICAVCKRHLKRALEEAESIKN